MTSLLLLGTVILVTWLCFWATDEKPTPPGMWCPFEIKDEYPGEAEGSPAPGDAPVRPGRRAAVAAPPSERPWARRGWNERPWKRRSGS